MDSSHCSDGVNTAGPHSLLQCSAEPQSSAELCSSTPEDTRTQQGLAREGPLPWVWHQTLLLGLLHPFHASPVEMCCCVDGTRKK